LHQAVEPTPPQSGGIDDGVQRVPVTDMAGQRVSMTARIDDTGGEFLARGQFSTGDNHPRPAPGETEAHGCAKSTASTGDQDHAISDIEQWIVHCATLPARTRSWS